MVFDLDPGQGRGIDQAVAAALVLRNFFERLELPSVPKTSGKRGLHILVPLAPGHTHEQAVEFAEWVTSRVAGLMDDVTVERSRRKRRGRLYLDAYQNGYGKTIVAPYSPRGLDGAPVSAPLAWNEVTPRLDPARFSIRTMPERLEKVGDLFEPALRGGVKLARGALTALRRRAAGRCSRGSTPSTPARRRSPGQQSPPQSVHPQAAVRPGQGRPAPALRHPEVRHRALLSGAARRSMIVQGRCHPLAPGVVR